LIALSADGVTILWRCSARRPSALCAGGRKFGRAADATSAGLRAQLPAPRRPGRRRYRSQRVGFRLRGDNREVVMRALIIVDMVNAFVDGKLANPKAQAIIAPLQRLLQQARAEGWVVVFSNDAHQPEDPELRVWGEHAMAGTHEAEVIPQLAPREGEIVSPK